MVSALVPFGNVGVGLIGSEFGVAFVRLSCQNQCARTQESVISQTVTSDPLLRKIKNCFSHRDNIDRYLLLLRSFVIA